MFNPPVPNSTAIAGGVGSDRFNANTPSPPTPSIDSTQQHILAELKEIYRILSILIATLQRSGIPGLAEIDVTDNLTTTKVPELPSSPVNPPGSAGGANPTVWSKF